MYPRNEIKNPPDKARGNLRNPGGGGTLVVDGGLFVREILDHDLGSEGCQ
jgi:hypothetical protein